LVSRPVRTLEAVRARLERRLALHGVKGFKIIEEERCFIPMGGPPAPLPQSVVAFGGAARMVHPATGYLLARVLRTAPRLSRALRSAFDEGLDPWARSERAWEAVWPKTERGAHDLARFGMEVLLDLDTEGTAEFFRTFFSTPPERWESYLAGGARAGDVRAAMLSVFGKAGWGLRFRLARAGFGPNGNLLRRALFVR
ncbi:MAG: lycopene cyclase family protein, partial [Myxococcota bacterium]